MLEFRSIDVIFMVQDDGGYVGELKTRQKSVNAGILKGLVLRPLLFLLLINDLLELMMFPSL